jgi:cobalamin biosynthesis protein CbiD
MLMKEEKKGEGMEVQRAAAAAAAAAVLSLEKLEKLEKLEEILLPRRAMLDREKVSRCVEMLSRRSRK